ncbi:MAG: O-antigen polymerase [Bacteroidota bacterium]
MNFKLTHKAYIRILSVIWILYGIYLISVVTKVDDMDIIYSVLLGGVVTHFSLFPFLKNWYKKGSPLLLDWFRLATFLFIILNFFNILDELNTDSSAFRDYVIEKRYILPSVFVIFIGLIGLNIGEKLVIYFSGNSLLQNKNYVFKYSFVNFDFFAFVSIIIAFIQIYLILTGQIGYGVLQENTTSTFSFLFQFVIISSPLVLSIFTIFKYLYKYNGTIFNIVYVFYFFTQIIYGFLSGMKESIIVPFIIVLIPYLLGGYKIPKKLFYIGLVLGLLIYPLNDNYRTILNEMPTMSKNEAFLLATGKTFTIGLSDNITKGTGNFSDRLSLFPYLVYAVDKESSWTYYKNMDRYIYLPIAWILPRAIIPDKPKSETGSVLNDMVYGRDTNSISATTYGWVYFEGGYFYVLFLFILFGAFISYFQFKIGMHTFYGLVLYIGILVNLLKVENDVYFLISGILQGCLLSYIFYKIFIRQTKLKLISKAN